MCGPHLKLSSKLIKIHVKNMKLLTIPRLVFTLCCQLVSTQPREEKLTLSCQSFSRTVRSVRSKQRDRSNRKKILHKMDLIRSSTGVADLLNNSSFHSFQRDHMIMKMEERTLGSQSKERAINQSESDELLYQWFGQNLKYLPEF